VVGISKRQNCKRAKQGRDKPTACGGTYPSPTFLSPQWQALLAGAAEWLSEEFGLPHPAWTDGPKYFLVNPWDPLEDFGLDMSEFIDDKLARSPEAFCVLNRTLWPYAQKSISDWKNLLPTRMSAMFCAR
jgi:hypothetical protein